MEQEYYATSEKHIESFTIQYTSISADLQKHDVTVRGCYREGRLS